MILTYVNKGTSGPDGINYLFSEKDANGRERNPPAELLEGDVFLTKYLIGNNPRDQKYSSYALSFRDNEKVTDEQLKEILQSLRETFCPGLGPDRVNMLAVKHTDKSNIEVHIIINNEELTTGRQFNPWPPGDRSKKLQQDFCAYWNHKLGFEQVVANPFKAAFSRFDAKVPKERKEQYFETVGNKDGTSTKQRKEKLSSIVTNAVMSGKVNNRKELIGFLESNSCKITRKGKDYLSVVLPGKEKPIRFRGGCFMEDVDYRSLIAKHNTASKNLTTYQFKKIEGRLQDAMEFKRQLHEKIYAPRRIRLSKPKHLEIKPVSTVKPVSSAKPNLEKHTTGRAIVPTKLSSTKQNKFSNFRSIGISSSVGNTLLEKIGSVELQMTALGIKLSNAPFSQRAEIERRIFELKTQIALLQQQLIEQKKAELNSGNKDKFKI